MENCSAGFASDFRTRPIQATNYSTVSRTKCSPATKITSFIRTAKKSSWKFAQHQLELWTYKISKQLNSELCCKFVASNLLATEQISNKKYRPVLKAFKKVGAPVGDTHQNLDGFNIFWGVQADKLWQDQKQTLAEWNPWSASWWSA